MYEICKHADGDFSLTLLDLTDEAQVDKQLFQGTLHELEEYLTEVTTTVFDGYVVVLRRVFNRDQFSVCTVKNSDEIIDKFINTGYSERGNLKQIMKLIREQFGYKSVSPTREPDKLAVDPNSTVKLTYTEAIEVLKALHFMSEGYNSTEVASTITSTILSVKSQGGYTTIRVANAFERFVIWLCLCSYQSVALMNGDTSDSECYTTLLEKFN